MQIFMFLFLISLTDSNESIFVRDTVIIDSVPFVKFCYGSSPQAAAMMMTAAGVKPGTTTCVAVIMREMSLMFSYGRETTISSN